MLFYSEVNVILYCISHKLLTIEQFHQRSCLSFFWVAKCLLPIVGHASRCSSEFLKIFFFFKILVVKSNWRILKRSGVATWSTLFDEQASNQGNCNGIWLGYLFWFYKNLAKIILNLTNNLTYKMILNLTNIWLE